MEIENVNGTELAAELASQVEQFFLGKRRALRVSTITYIQLYNLQSLSFTLHT